MPLDGEFAQHNFVPAAPTQKLLPGTRFQHFPITQEPDFQELPIDVILHKLWWRARQRRLKTLESSASVSSERA